MGKKGEETEKMKKKNLVGEQGGRARSGKRQIREHGERLAVAKNR